MRSGWRKESVLTSARLPGGRESGGILLEGDDGLVFVLFSDEELEVGDRVVDARGLALTVTGVDHGTLSGRRITVLDVDGAGPRH